MVRTFLPGCRKLPDYDDIDSGISLYIYRMEAFIL